MSIGVVEKALHDNPRMATRFAAFVIWAAVAASLVFWALRLGADPLAAPPHAAVVSTAGGFNGDLARVLGADAPPTTQAPAAAPVVQADARFRLVGVVAPRAPGANAQGLALIDTDGKPAKAYRVGAAVDGDLVLQAVRARGATLGLRGQPAQVALELPALLPPSTGTLPGALPPGPRLSLPRPPTLAPQAVPTPQAAAPAEDDDEPEAAPDPAARPLQQPLSGPARPPT